MLAAEATAAAAACPDLVACARPGTRAAAWRWRKHWWSKLIARGEIARSRDGWQGCGRVCCGIRSGAPRGRLDREGRSRSLRQQQLLRQRRPKQNSSDPSSIKLQSKRRRRAAAHLQLQEAQEMMLRQLSSRCFWRADPTLIHTYYIRARAVAAQRDAPIRVPFRCLI